VDVPLRRSLLITADRLWNFLPSFLKRAPKLSPVTGLPSLIWSLCRALGDDGDLALDAGNFLAARGLANRAYPSLFPDYYVDPSDQSNPSEERKDDLYLLGVSRGLYRRESETWFEFEARLILFPTDVKSYGTPAGLIRELERTGLEVELLEELAGDPQSWVLLSAEDACSVPDNQESHLFDFVPSDETDLSDPTDPSDPRVVRGCRIYDSEEEYFTFYLALTDPTAPSNPTDYSLSELRQIIRRVKPAHTRAYVRYPSAEFYEAIQ
jgi:hypothetical protein